MITMTKISLGASACPNVAHLGYGASVAFGTGVAASWTGKSVQHLQLVPAGVRAVDRIPAYNTTRLSAPPERSP